MYSQWEIHVFPVRHIYMYSWWDISVFPVRHTCSIPNMTYMYSQWDILTGYITCHFACKASILLRYNKHYRLLVCLKSIQKKTNSNDLGITNDLGTNTADWALWNWEHLTDYHAHLKNKEYKIQTHKRFKRMLFIRTKHNLQIFGVIHFIKLQNNT